MILVILLPSTDFVVDAINCSRYGDTVVAGVGTVGELYWQLDVIQDSNRGSKMGRIMH